MNAFAIDAIEGALRLRARLAGIGRYPKPGVYFGPGGIDEAEALCLEAGRNLLGFLKPPARVAAIDVREHSGRRSWVDGGRWRIFTFASPLPSGRAGNDRVELRLSTPEGGANGRVIVFHHPIYQSRWAVWEWLVAPFRDRATVALLTAPYHFSRCPPGEFAGEGYVNPNPWRLFEGLRQWAWDQKAASTLLCEQGLEVGAVVGFSLGAFETLLMASAGEIAVPIVSIASTNRYAFGVRHGVLGEGLLEALTAIGFSWERFEKATASLELDRYAARARHLPLLFVSGRYDRVDPPPSSERLERALATRESLRLDAGHGTLVIYRRRIWDRMRAFFEDHAVI